MRKFLIRFNGKEIEVEAEEITVNNRGAQAAPSVPAPSAPVVTAPRPAAPSVPAAAASQAAPAGGSTNSVTAPMPGTILKMNVSVGDEVKKGQVLLVLEAMKMENEIKSPVDGKVVAVHVSNGAVVNVGNALVELV